MLKKLDKKKNPQMTLPDGNYLFTGLVHVEIKDGKSDIHQMVGCYHTEEGDQYLVDSTGQASHLLPLFVSLPSKINESLEQSKKHFTKKKLSK